MAEQKTTQTSVDRAAPARVRPARGFTLIELLVVIAVVATLIGILLPALGQARRTAKAVREVAGARQVMLAYTMYADANRGKLLVGFAQNSIYNEMQRRNELPRDAGGETISGQPAMRYPWRLAPYLDHNFDGLYLDPRVTEVLADSYGQGSGSHVPLTYVVSLYPSFGLNSYFLGGGGDSGDTMPFSVHGRRLFGDFHASRFDQPRSPSTLMVFASARRMGDPSLVTGYGMVEGSYVVKPPYLYGTTGRQWQESYEPGTENPGPNAGFVSLRHDGRGAAAMLDGHAELLGWDGFNDMRLWADQADAPDWRIPVRLP